MSVCMYNCTYMCVQVYAYYNNVLFDMVTHPVLFVILHNILK